MSDEARDAARRAWVHAGGDDLAEAMRRCENSRSNAFNAGYAARDAEVCVWVLDGENEQTTQCRKLFAYVQLPKCCPNCGRRVKVNEVK